MNNKSRIRTTMALWPVFLLMCVVGSVRAAEPAPPPIVAETFVCNYNDGNDVEDLLKVRDYYVKQAEKAGIKPPTAYLWSLYKGAATAAGMAPDTVWFNLHENLDAFTAFADAGAAAEEFTDVLPRFYNVSTCNAGLAALRPVFGGEPEGDAPDTTFIASLACNYVHGAGESNMPDLIGHMAGVMGEMGDNAPNFSAVMSPITGGPTAADLYLFSVFDNAAGWGNYVGQLYNTDAGQRMRNHMGMVMDCNVSLWNGTQVISDS